MWVMVCVCGGICDAPVMCFVDACHIRVLTCVCVTLDGTKRRKKGIKRGWERLFFSAAVTSIKSIDGIHATIPGFIACFPLVHTSYIAISIGMASSSSSPPPSSPAVPSAPAVPPAPSAAPAPTPLVNKYGVNLQSISRDPRFCDFTVKYIDTEGMTHSFPIFSGLLHVCSGYFRQFFDSNSAWKETGTKEHVFTEADLPGGPAVLCTILEYFHGGVFTPMSNEELNRHSVVSMLRYLDADLSCCVEAYMTLTLTSALMVHGRNYPDGHRKMMNLLRCIFSPGPVDDLLLPVQAEVVAMLQRFDSPTGWTDAQYEEITTFLRGCYSTTCIPSKKNLLQLIPLIRQGVYTFDWVRMISSSPPLEEMVEGEYRYLVQMCPNPPTSMILLMMRTNELSRKGSDAFVGMSFWMRILRADTNEPTNSIRKQLDFGSAARPKRKIQVDAEEDGEDEEMVYVDEADDGGGGAGPSTPIANNPDESPLVPRRPTKTRRMEE